MNITFLPKNVVFETNQAITILEAASQAGVAINGNCSGNGTCGKCKVWITGASGARREVLACQEILHEDLTVEVPNESEMTSRKSSRSIQLPQGFVQDALEAETKAISYGLAVDIGTTSVVAMLWNLQSGECVATQSFANPQGAYGADVISRITYAAESTEHLKILQQRIIDGINGALQTMLGQISDGNTNQVQRAVIAANTTMSSLFVGADPAPLATAPFSPIYEGGVSYGAAELGLHMADDAEIYVIPNIAGHVGSDITAGLLTTDLYETAGDSQLSPSPNNFLYLDIGTNGELVLTASGRALTCSTAAGPAFEGSTIRYGMRAADGAIERVRIPDRANRFGDVQIETIGGAPPVGICGSGIIDAVGELVRTGIVDQTGRVRSAEELEEEGYSDKVIARLSLNEGVYDFILGNGPNGEILITQKDIREVQLAKAAIAAGIKVMMEKLGIDASDLDGVYVAGAFGSFIRVESAVNIGLLPQVDLGKIQSIGNAAGIGASMILLSAAERRKAEALVAVTEHVQLAENPEFQNVYFSEMNFPL